MTRPIKKARVTRRRKYYGGGKKRGARHLKKLEEYRMMSYPDLPRGQMNMQLGQQRCVR